MDLSFFFSLITLVFKSIHSSNGEIRDKNWVITARSDTTLSVLPDETIEGIKADKKKKIKIKIDKAELAPRGFHSKHTTRRITPVQFGVFIASSYLIRYQAVCRHRGDREKKIYIYIFVC